MCLLGRLQLLVAHRMSGLLRKWVGVGVVVDWTGGMMLVGDCGLGFVVVMFGAVTAR